LLPDIYYCYSQGLSTGTHQDTYKLSFGCVVQLALQQLSRVAQCIITLIASQWVLIEIIELTCSSQKQLWEN